VTAKDLNDEISGAYKEGVFNKARIYASFKIKSPAFYSGDKRPQPRLLRPGVVVRDCEK
jgi:hypothetical protein